MSCLRSPPRGTTWRAARAPRPPGVALGEAAPALVPTTAFYNRHARDRGPLDRKITAGRFKDLPSYVPGALPCWCWPVRPGRRPGRSNDGPGEWTPPDQAYWCRDDDRFSTILGRYRAST